jgi:hypothetical protein
MLTGKMKYRASNLGGAVCLECGSHVEDIPLHNNFHEKLEQQRSFNAKDAT